MYMVDDTDKTYIVFDKATMEQLAKKLNEAMAKMKEQMAKLPPEQRAQMEQMMGGAGADRRKAVDRGRGGHRQVGQGRWPQLQALERHAQWRAR